MPDVEAILARIAYDGSRDISLQTLKALQLAFLHHVPFENLDIHLGRKIELSAAQFHRKIVAGQRGGFCYECNTLFRDLLQALGFKVRLVAATMQTALAMHLEYEHMALLVSLDADYLVDVGNGQSCLQALRIDGDEIVRFEGIEYRLAEYGEAQALFYRTAGEDWAPRYSFSTRPCELEQFAATCHVLQTSAASHFTHKKVVTLARPDGRVTLVERELSINQAGRTEVRELASNAEYAQVLQDYFNIRLETMPANW